MKADYFKKNGNMKREQKDNHSNMEVSQGIERLPCSEKLFLRTVEELKRKETFYNHVNSTEKSFRLI